MTKASRRFLATVLKNADVYYQVPFSPARLAEHDRVSTVLAVCDICCPPSTASTPLRHAHLSALGYLEKLPWRAISRSAMRTRTLFASILEISHWMQPPLAIPTRLQVRRACQVLHTPA